MRRLSVIKKTIAYMTIVSLMILPLITGCSGNTPETPVQENEEETRPQIGMCFDSFIIERWQRDRDVFVSKCKELGADVNVQNANGDIETQKEQIDYFIQKGMDVIVIVCIDSDSLSESVKKAKDAGIKVIAYDRLINNADLDLYISFDNEEVGTMMGQTLVANGLNGGKVIMIGGSPADNNVSLVESAFIKVMNDNNVEVIDTTHCDGWKAEIASDYIYDNFETVEQADAIMCGNDNLASQVVRVLSEKRLAGKVMITGQDADLEACQRIVEGTQIMTVYKPVEKLAQRAAECAVAMANDEKISGNDVSTINNGNGTVPFVKLEPVCVTENNIDSAIISTGFHLKEEVYLNVHK